ncbi:MAG: amidohydrolase [Rhodospirillaceae bacterium]|nr:amidohydrolase [Rhodospirillaceae bacterium]
MSPETIYINGNVITVDERFSIVQAFAVNRGKFIAVGDNASVDKLAGPATKFVDLKGATVTPGFIDTHPHTVAKYTRDLGRLPLYGVKSVAEILKLIGVEAGKSSPGTWIVTTAIGVPPDFFHLPESLVEKRWPTRAELDKAAPNNPVYIPVARTWTTPSLFNSAALARLGVARDTLDDARMKIMRDSATGEPTGEIYGLDMYNRANTLRPKLLSMLPPPQSAEAQILAIKRAMADNLAVGVTTIYEGHTTQPAFLDFLRKMRASGDMINRTVYAHEVPVGRSISEIDAWMEGLKAAENTGDDLFKIEGVTVSVDGATQFGGALMNKPYLDPYGRSSNGESTVSTGKLTDIGRLAVKHGLRLNVQAAGDAAGDMTIAAFEAVNKETPIKDRQWLIQHFQHPSRDNISRLKALGILATTYSNVDYSKGADTYVRRFPDQPEFWKRVVPLRWWIDGGVVIAQGTDGDHIEPMFTIWESLVRIDGRTGKSLLSPEKTITRAEAIQLYTINGAKILKWDDRLGSIEPGKLADFVVMEKDILTVPMDEIRDTKVLMTVMGGIPVYGKVPN